MTIKTGISTVENTHLQHTQSEACYAPTEKIRTLVVDHFPELGKLTALRFLEWAQHNPGWTVALPTGKTPEHFIKWTHRILNQWDSPEIRKLLETYQLDPGNKPDLSTQHFVQIDEFYPFDSSWHNSFHSYVNHYYLQGFGFDPKKALLIDPNNIGLKPGERQEDVWGDAPVDLSLRTRRAHNALEVRQQQLITEVDAFCHDYEARIRQLGGIGFFLGGIGPDGHIGFNVRGSDHYSTTRLCETNYETQAAAAGDLGGIEISSKRLVITIGLGTITHNSNTTAIIIAAGEAKAGIVANAIQKKPHNLYPATALHKLEQAAFYITKGAAKHMEERSHHSFAAQSVLDFQTTQEHLISTALKVGKNLTNLNSQDLAKQRSGNLLLERLKRPLELVLSEVAHALHRKFERGLKRPQNERFLHTAPHHDDIMLGYLPYLVSFAAEPSNHHVFNYLTSGFNAVTNDFVLERLEYARSVLKQPEAIDVATLAIDNSAAAQEDLDRFLDALAKADKTGQADAIGRRTLRCLHGIYGDSSLPELNKRLDQLSHYFRLSYPGKKDVVEVQRLKGMLREWEAEVLWSQLGFPMESVVHSRLGFYKGDIFTEEPELNRDVLPVLELMRKVKPTIVTVALDPEGSGPDTHYKVLQAVSAALKLYRDETGNDGIKVWGYRNVWYRFSPAEADIIAPVSLGQMAQLDRLFLDSFASQAVASFPSYALEGPFSTLARTIQVDQYEQLTTLLGKDHLRHHADRNARAARGLIYLKEMDLDSFFETSRDLRKSME